jgi:hypothetical protein
MHRETLKILLSASPATKYDAYYFFKKAVQDQSDRFLFRNKFLNYTIFFKYSSSNIGTEGASDRPVSTIIYFPYDMEKPVDGGESFVYSEDNFWRFFRYKFGTDAIDIAATEADNAVLRVFDSIPTFSPLLVELAFERSGLDIPALYVEFTSEVREKLKTQLKGRLRPLIVAAYEKQKINIERAVDDMTDKLFALRDVNDILPLVKALRIPESKALEVFSSWIGISYFEYEYTMLQLQLKDFSRWLSTNQKLSPGEAGLEIAKIVKSKEVLQRIFRKDWGRVTDIYAEYRQIYNDLLYHGRVDKFSKYIMECKNSYWEMGESLAKFDQTSIAWKQHHKTLLSQKVSGKQLMSFIDILQTLHASNFSAEPAAVHDGPTEFTTLSTGLF